MNPGIYTGIDNADYHAGEGISKSLLDLINRSPAHLRARLDRSDAHQPSAAQTLGSAVHAYVLEGVSVFESRYAIAPICDRRTKAGKETWENFTAENPGKVYLTHDDMETIEAMSKSLYAHNAARGLLGDAEGVAEVSAYWHDQKTGILCRCRPDFWRSGGVLVDLKTTDDASPEAFSRSIAAYRYHVQAAWYIDGCREAHVQSEEPPHLWLANHFVFVAVEKRPPYAVACYTLDPQTIELGREEYRANLDRYAACLQSDQWPSYTETVAEIGVPLWYAKKTMEQNV